MKTEQKLTTGIPAFDDALKDGTTIDELTTIRVVIPKSRVRNFGSKTMLLNVESGELKEVGTISDEQIRKMKHALGISYDRNNREVVPNKIYRPKLKSHRNHYQIDQCDDWDDLVEKGLARKQVYSLNFYLVTAKGITYLQELGYQFEKEKE